MDEVIFTPISNTDSVNSARDVELGDLDGDGDLDVIFARNNGNDTVYLNDGNGQFTDTDQALGGNNIPSEGIDLGDIDGDGDYDAVVAVQSSNSISNKVYRNDGSGNFTVDDNTNQPVLNRLLGSPNTDVELGDIDGDEDLDVVFGSTSNRSSLILFNDGTGTFRNNVGLATSEIMLV